MVTEHQMDLAAVVEVIRPASFFDRHHLTAWVIALCLYFTWETYAHVTLKDHCKLLNSRDTSKSLLIMLINHGKYIEELHSDVDDRNVSWLNQTVSDLVSSALFPQHIRIFFPSNHVVTLCSILAHRASRAVLQFLWDTKLSLFSGSWEE